MLSRWITELLIAWRWPLLVLAGALGMAAWLTSPDLEYDHSIENMFAADDPLIGPYEKLKRTFGGNEIVLAVYRDANLFNPDGQGMKRLATLNGRLKRIPGVKAVLSIDQPRGHAITNSASGLSRRLRSLFEGYTHDATGKIAACVCILRPEAETDVPRREVIDKLRVTMAEYDDGMIAGEPVMVVDGFRYIQQDGRRLGRVSTLLLAATIILCFRSLRWVVVPIAVVQIALLLTNAVLVRSGFRMSMVSTMLTAIVTVVGIATVVHVIVRFREGRQRGLEHPAALSYAGGLLAVPIFWACATDAVGFAALCAASVGPVRDFGLMMATGAMAVVVCVALVLPGTALLGAKRFRRFDKSSQKAWGEGLLGSQLDRLARIVQRHPGPIGLAAILVTALAGVGIARLQVETDFTKNFRADSPIVRSYEFVEEELGGAGIWDVIVPAQHEDDWKDWRYLRRLRRLEDRLRDEVRVPGPEGKPIPGLTKVLSPADAVLAGFSGEPDEAPFRDVTIRAAFRRLQSKMSALMDSLHGEDPQQPGHYYVRIMLRARERQPAWQKQSLIEQVRKISREEFPPRGDSPGAEVTGLFVLLSSLVDSMIADQWLTFAVASAGIGLMMVVAFRSPVLALMALVPNALPILMVTGLMGWLGLKINMGAAMIAAVSMGLSIDSSIHYISAFRRERAEGKTAAEAIGAVHQSVGSAAVFSTLALIVGFAVLCTSQFVPTIYFGFLVSLSMLGGLVGNLVVLPLLLMLVSGHREAKGTETP